MKRWTLIAAGLLAAFLAATAIAYRFALQTVRAQIVAALGPGAEVGAIEVALSGVRVDAVRLPPGDRSWPAEDLLRAESITVVPALRSLLSDTITVHSVTVRKPYLSVLRTRNDGLLVVPTLLRHEPAGATADAS